MVHGRRSRRPRGPAVFGLVAVIALSLLGSACSSSGSKSATSSSAAPGSSAAQSGSSDSTASSAGDPLAAAAAAAKTAEQAPTKIPQTVPLTGSVAGKKIVFLQCDITACSVFGKGISAAARVLGMDYSAISFKVADASTFTAAVDQAKQEKPAAVIITGQDYALWKNQIPAFKSAGIAIIALFVGGSVPITDTVPVDIGGTAFSEANAALEADWFIGNSQGKGHALIVNVPNFPAIADRTNGFVAEAKKRCPDCQVQKLDITLAQVQNNSVTSAVVSALQKDPSIKYVFQADGDFGAGMVQALKGAGLNGITSAGISPLPADEQNIANGSSGSWLIVSVIISGWVAVDAAARHILGMTIPPGDGGIPYQLLTKDNIGTPSADLVKPVDYASQYANLWKKAS
jgi:ribose transport system substrate-binding protein